MSDSKVKFKKNDPEQISLGVQVFVNAYKSKCKYKNKAIEKALKRLDTRDAARLPRVESLVHTFGFLERAMKEKTRPEEDARGWQAVVQMAYDELTKGQLHMSEIKPEGTAEDPAGEVSVTDVDAQEDLMEQDAEAARVEVSTEIPFTDLNTKLFPEEFDIWQSDLYSFIANRDNCVKIDDGMITLYLSDFEYFFRRGYHNG